MEIEHVEDEFFCPMTAKTEQVLIRITTKTRTNRAVAGGSSCIVFKNLEECTGLFSCRIQTDHGRSSSFDWEHCPLIEILKTK